jgi:iron complex outermembrane receptor protein
MISHRKLLLAAASAAALAAAAWSSEAAAQVRSADETEVEELVVTGTRAPGRTRLDTISPVDVISDEALSRQGTSTELAQALSNLTPAIDFPRPAITDGTDHVRPATLRGLAPDQTLVLVNGVRGHVGALVNVNGSIGRGSTAFDLNTIPTVAISQVEVLREGASAQYGSDAIAGVINLRLREAREGGGVTVNWGNYDTEVVTSRGRRRANDGFTASVAGWVGLPLPNDGFLTVSTEFVTRHPTNRSDFANGTALPAYGRPIVLGRYGDPDVESGSIWLNAGLPLSETWTLYGTYGWQNRDGEAAATARAYNNAGNVPAVYPGGFLPIIATDVEDLTTQGGLRGELGGFKVDASVSYGYNDLDYTVLNSINASYGASSPTQFRAGGLFYDQLVIGVDASRPYEVGLAKPLNVAFGVEYRKESFKINAGDPTSYTRGPFNAAPVSQGFPGFKPSNATDVDRNNWSAYLDLEGHLTEALSFGVAGRYEDYSDFGDTFTGKLSGRYDFTDALALRGSVSTGFHAPALQQQFFTYTSTNNTLVGTTFQLIEVGTFPVDSPLARALGSSPLEPEESVNYSLGVVYRAGGFELTVDAYRIDIDNRITLSETLPNNNTPAATADAINAILRNFNVSGARFFINGVDTTTEGVDIVARYRFDFADWGRLDLTGAANFNQTDVTKTPDLPALTNLPSPPFLFDRGNVLTYEQGTPERKLVATADWSNGDVGVTLKATNYDSVLIPNNTASFDYETGDATLIDAEVRYTWPIGVTTAIGANNITDEYPNFTPGTINSPTGSIGFPGYSPFGFNGRFLYARISYGW